jgi:hypothetical protein
MSPVLEGVKLLPPAPPYTYLGVAENMITGLRPLSLANPSSPMASSLVASHVLECLLKALLSLDGNDKRLKEKGLRHNIHNLWAIAQSEMPQMVSQIPDWAITLSNLHNSPYYLRYSTGIHGLVLPALEPMLTQMNDLLLVVRNAVNKKDL